MKAVSNKSYGKHLPKALASHYDSIFFNNGSSKLIGPFGCWISH
jgi:hypothetical protein